MSAHRFSYTITFGPIPKGQQVMHRCDNKKCVRPEHLRLGTQKDNLHDMYAKGRARVVDRTGESRAKLSMEKARQIRRLYESRLFSLGELARKFGVRQKAISSIVNNKSWREKSLIS
jgi:hypothetical protein